MTNRKVGVVPPFVPYIRFADYAIRDAGWIVPERRLLDYLLIYVQEGVCEIMIDGAVIEFTTGDFCLIQPAMLCSLRGITDTITPYAHFDLFFNPMREESFMTLPGQIELSEFRRFLQPRLSENMKVDIPGKFRPTRPFVNKESLLKLIGLWQDGDRISQLEADHLLGEMVIALLKQFGDKMQQNPSQQPQSLNWITSYFSYNLTEPLTLNDMAKRARLSPSRFSALFKEKFGVPPHQYLLNMRIQHARELIKNGDYTLEEIACFCGFSDASHFSKAFKKITGKTPGQYRKINETPS